MSGPACTLVAQHGIPTVVLQALDDTQLPHVARLAMWHLRLRLDLLEYREVKGESLAAEMRVKERTALDALALLTARGYLDMRPMLRRSRGYRLLWSRRGDVQVRVAA
jgi:hypothetical protein